MRQIKTFQDILAWQKAHQLVLQVYQLTNYFPQSERYALSSQLRRAVVSVASNIVEGFKRKSVKDSLHFYNIAEASLEEVKYQLLIAKDLLYINEEQYSDIKSIFDEVGKTLYGWIKSQKLNHLFT